MPKDTLKTFEKTFLYSKKPVALFGGCNRRTNNNENIAVRIGANLTKRIANFINIIN